MPRMNHLHQPDHDLAIHISTRNTEMPDHIAAHARERLAKAHRFGILFDRVDVMLHGERNPRIAAAARRVEITGHAAGSVIRAEAAAADWLTAFDSCLDRWHERVRRTSERRAARRRGRYGHAQIVNESAASLARRDHTRGLSSADSVVSFAPDSLDVDAADVKVGPFLVREKTHAARPMTIEQAIEALEMVGHDFYAFVDSDSGMFCVVYQRKAFTYGLLRLAPADATPR